MNIGQWPMVPMGPLGPEEVLNAEKENRIIERTLSDNSKVYDVSATDGYDEIIYMAVDEEAAIRIMELLEDIKKLTS